MKLGERCPGAIVFYEACASNPLPTFSRIMEILGLEFSPKQLRISENIDVSKIGGDLSLVENARDVADASISKRRRELEKLRINSLVLFFFDRVKRVADCFADFESRGIISSGDPDRDKFVSALSEASSPNGNISVRAM